MDKRNMITVIYSYERKSSSKHVVSHSYPTNRKEKSHRTQLKAQHTPHTMAKTQATNAFAYQVCLCNTHMHAHTCMHQKQDIVSVP